MNDKTKTIEEFKEWLYDVHHEYERKLDVLNDVDMLRKRQYRRLKSFNEKAKELIPIVAEYMSTITLMDIINAEAPKKVKSVYRELSK